MMTQAADTRWQRLPLYLGGLMGPFGAIVILPMFPELRESFNASSAAVSWGFTIYLLPFAATLLVSGTLGERWGRRRTVRCTYLVYAVASAGCALAPNLWMFLGARAMQGVANAFITPLLVAGLAEVVSPALFGRAVGIYSSFQAAGGALAPVIGGLAADANWRWAFVGTGLMAIVLATVPPQGEPVPLTSDASADTTSGPAFRDLLTRPMVILGVGVMAAAAGPIGINVLVGVTARDDLGLTGRQAGLVLLAGPVMAMLTGPLWGRLVDRFGARASGLTSAAASMVVAALLAFADTPISLAIMSGLSGALIGFVAVVVQVLAPTIVPSNRGGALSFILAFRFFGHGIGPVLWIPVLERNVQPAFFGAAALGIITLVAFFIVIEPKGSAPVEPALQ
jgi:ACDE family multidrug resistance protein